MAAKMAILMVVVALALASQTASAASDHDLYKFCRRVSPPASASTSIVAYEAAMKRFKSVVSLFSPSRQVLAAAWRAVTYDEPCSAKSLAYVHSIHVCQPLTDPIKPHLASDARKYAKKCFTAEYMEKALKEYAGAQVEKVLTDELLAAYRAANPKEARVSILFDERCKPEHATEVLAEALKRDFPQEVAQFSGSGSFKAVDKFLTQHLYKPCASFVKRVDKIMDKIDAASYYAFGNNICNLPQNVQDAVFRFKFCGNLEAERQRDEFTGLMAGLF